MNNCIHHWICGDEVDGGVPAVCKHCGAEKVFKPRFVDGRSVLDVYSPWVNMRLRTLSGTSRLSSRHSGELSGDWENGVRALEGSRS